MAKNTKPPILRVTLVETPTVKAQAPQTVIKTEIEKKEPSEREAILVTVIKAPSSLEQDYSNEYPPLDVSEWDAPEKSTLLDITPANISAFTVNNCKQTCEQVLQHSALAAHISQKTTDELRAVFDGVHSTANKATCAELSQRIAQDCAQLSTDCSVIVGDLSRQTAEMCKQLSSAQVINSFEDSVYKTEVGQLSLNTALECHRLAQETVNTCHQLVKATALQSLSDSKTASHRQDQAAMRGFVGDLFNLSAKALDDTSRLSKQTSDDSANASAEMRRIIMSL